jgi:zinc transport system substrate-binding protein
MRLSLISSIALFAAAPALAEVPRVVTDITPVQGLAAMVMGDLGSPEVIVQPNESGHDFALRPSHAKAISKADLVLWIGEEMNPALGRQIDALAKDAKVLELIDLPGSLLLEFRDEAVFEDHDDHKDDHADHDDADHNDDHKDHDDHTEHKGHDDHADHDDHKDHDDHAGHDHADHHGHHHEGTDPPIWLAPENAQLWVKAIAAELSALDPENASTYFLNAARAGDLIATAQTKAKETLAAHKDAPIAVAHDAFQYFDHSFDLNILGAISDGDDVAPGPKRMAQLKEYFAHTQPACFLSEPGFDLRLLEAASEGTKLPGVVAFHPRGGHIEVNQDFYPTLITDLADKIATCVSQ